MIPAHHKQGGVAVGHVSALEAWEARLLHELRQWCAGPQGQAEVWNGFAVHLPRGTAAREIRVFEDLIGTLSAFARRPLVRHAERCSCLGADEAVFLHIVRAATAGELHDATMVAALVVLPAHAEHVALLAAQVGAAARTRSAGQTAQPDTGRPPNVVRLN